jgi:hypothetical protein
MLPRHTRRFRAATAALLSACYQYTPRVNAALPAGTDVRIELTPAGATALLPILGSGTTAVEGRVLSASDSGFRISMSGTLKRVDGNGGGGSGTTRTVWAGESVMIPRSAAERIDERSINGKQTAFAIAVGSVLTAVGVRLLIHVVGSGGSEGEGGTPVTPP